MKKVLWLLCGVTGIGVYGCVTDPPVLHMKETGTVGVRQTEHDDLLYKFGKMLKAYTGRTSSNPIYLQISPVTNDTAGVGQLPTNITRMVTTALDKIGTPIVNVIHDPVYQEQEIQMRKGIKLQVQPEYTISGAITEFDKDLASTGTSQNVDLSIPLGKSSADTSVDKRNDSQESRMTIDFSTREYITQNSTGSHTTNTITIAKESKSSGWAFSIFGTGIGISGNISKSQGIHAAIRALVEVSILQLLGHEFRVPYWRLMPDGKPDKRLVQRIQDDIQEGGPEAAADNILSAYGYFLNAYPRKSPKAVEAMNQILSSQKIDYKATSIATIPSSILADAWMKMPISDNMAKHIADLKRMQESPEPPQQAAKPSETVTAQQALQLTVDTPRNEYKIHDNLTITLNLSENAHVYCFWEQGNKTTVKILPNRFQPKSLLKAGKNFIPNSNMKFSIELEYPKTTESIACFASRADLTEKLPQEIGSTNLEIIEGYSLDKVRKIMMAADSNVVEGSVQVSVK